MITLLRLGHRIYRDQRITSHVALTARALGASAFVYTGEKDENMEKSISDVASRWGGKFSVHHSKKTKSYIKNFDGFKIHLSMYGEKHTETINSLKKMDYDNLLLIVGGPKVSNYVYAYSDFNTAIGWQPHSEVAAIGIFLHSLLGDEYLYKKYPGASINIDGTGKKARRSDRVDDL